MKRSLAVLATSAALNQAVTQEDAAFLVPRFEPSSCCLTNSGSITPLSVIDPTAADPTLSTALKPAAAVAGPAVAAAMARASVISGC